MKPVHCCALEKSEHCCAFIMNSYYSLVITYYLDCFKWNEIYLCFFHYAKYDDD